MKDSALRASRRPATSEESHRSDSTEKTAHMGRLSGSPANSYTQLGTANTVGGAVAGFPPQLPAVHPQYGGSRLMELIGRPSVVQAGVVITNVAALYVVSKSTGNCVSCWDFHRAGDNVSTVQMFGQYLAPATFMLGLDLALVVVGILLFGLSRQSTSPARALRGGALTLMATSLAAGILEFKALASISPMAREGSSWEDPLTVHLLMVNFVALIISLVIGAYFIRPSTNSLLSVRSELPDYSIPAEQ